MPDTAATLAKPLTRQLLSEQPLLRLAYTARNGEPRVIPIGFVWDETAGQLLMWTAEGAAKVAALRANPQVAAVIDVLGPPPRVLLLRGPAELTDTEGVPQGYLDASHRTMPPDSWDDFDAQVRSLYPAMVEIRVRPTWAKLLDFETTAPSRVEELAREAAARG